MQGRTIIQTLILFVFLICNETSLFSQHLSIAPKSVIRGIIVDQDEHQPLPGATVTLLTAENVRIRSLTTNNNGIFSFDLAARGTYLISISYLGYSAYKSQPIQITSQNVDLGTILLGKNNEMLQSVTITGSKKKPLIQSKSDRLIYNAGSDISNKAGTASDVMRKVPMLTVEPDGQLKMRGNSNFKVLLNGMPSAVMAKNLKEALKMIPASSIVSIEVITNPSAKYEAEGAAGVINIITKKRMNGTNGNLDLSAGNLEQSGNLALNMTKSKLSYALILNTSLQKERQTSEMTRNSLSSGQQTGQLFQKRDATQKDNGGYASLTTEYSIDSSQKIEAAISYWTGKWPERNKLYNLNRTSATTSEYYQHSTQFAKYNFYDLSLNYQKKFRKPGQELQIIAMGSSSKDLSEYTTDQFKMDGSRTFREQSPNLGTGKDWNLQADYAHPLNKSGNSAMEMGIRYTGTKSKNDYRVFNSHFPVDPSRSNVINYYQHIYAMYLGANIKSDSGTWSFRPGLRFEYTRLGADYQAINPSFGSSFANWVPGILISKSLGDKQEIKLNYTERIRRPWIWDMNPYVNASDPLNLTAGNPKLKPELTRMLELGHSYEGNNGFSLNTALYYNSNSNAIEQITTVNPSGVSFSTSQNIAAYKRLGADINTSFKLNPNWSVNAGGELSYLKFDARSMNLQNKGTFYTVNLNTTYTLPKNYSIQVFGDYGNGYITLQGRNSANYSYRLAARKELFNKKASLTLTANNLFQKNFMQKSSATAASFESNTSSRFYNRSISLSFSWQFGGFKQQDYSEKRFPNENENSLNRRTK